MPLKIHSLNHVSRETDDVDRLVKFYVDVLGCQVLERPNFGFGGAWLSIPGEPPCQMVHIIEKDSKNSLPEGPLSAPDRGTEGSSYPHNPDAIRRGHHIALRCDHIDEAKSFLKENGIQFAEAKIPNTERIQLFFFDPDGNGVEIGNFAPELPPVAK